MIELDMVYVSYFGDFLSNGSRESFEQNILFRLSPPRTAALATAAGGKTGRKRSGRRWERPLDGERADTGMCKSLSFSPWKNAIKR